jgi:hypothetical protein
VTLRKKIACWTLGTLGALLLGGAVFVHFTLGWSMLIGMLRYDTRQEGLLSVGDLAPVAVLHEIETGGVTRLFETPPARPVILVFGSFT